MFVYNTKNTLTSDAFKKLSAVAYFTQKVKLNSHSSAVQDKKNLRNIFCPTFTWIVRDFSLKTTVSSKEKLDRFLEPENYEESSQLSLKEFEKQKAKIEERNRIRENLLDTFKSMDCFYLPLPVAEGVDGMTYEDALGRLNELPKSKLRPQFEEAFLKVVNHIQNTFQVKMINNNVMNGPIMAEYMKQIIENINKNEQIYLMDTLNSSLKLISSEAFEKAKSEYEIKMNKFLSNGSLAKEWTTFYEFEKSTYKSSVELIRQSILNESLLNENLKKFENTIRTGERSGSYEYFIQLNKKANTKKNNDFISRKWDEKISKRVERAIEEFKTSNELSNEISRLKAEINGEIINCDNFEELWKHFLNEKNISQVLNHIDSSNRKQEEAEKERKRNLEEERRKHEQQIKQAQRSYIESPCLNIAGIMPYHGI